MKACVSLETPIGILCRTQTTGGDESRAEIKLGLLNVIMFIKTVKELPDKCPQNLHIF